ncbi:hypothetical protein BLNAU_3018 [Blattamonas nauphoetae]|uniref:Uncharacterized protein n=1 Tax=Blattamonas nauphoetae TaxID=2049346 RepID=A0ABQ9YDW7_9EUKA|nr:hypothetical protein BLNAU_3018 [Blattamonas nauphoetae]
MESLFFEHEIVNSLFLQQKDFILSTFKSIEESAPSPVVLATLARISLFPHLNIATCSLKSLFRVLKRDPPALTLLPSPIFPSSSPHKQYFGLSFLAALTKKRRTVFNKIQTNLPNDPSHLQKYLEITKDNPYFIAYSLNFCSYSFLLPTHLLNATPRINIDPEIIRELILFVKEAVPTVLTNISTIDTLIASLPSDSSPTTPFVSKTGTKTKKSLKKLRNQCIDFVNYGWAFVIEMTNLPTDPLKSSFKTIVLDDPYFSDLILNSLMLLHIPVQRTTIIAILVILDKFPSMRITFIEANLVGRMFETVHFVFLTHSESNTLVILTVFIERMLNPFGDDPAICPEHYRLLRACVLEPAKPFITFMFNNSDNLVLNEEDKAEVEDHLCRIHRHIQNMELRSDEHDSDFVSDIAIWETRTMVEMANEEIFQIVFQRLLNRSREWKQSNQERQKKREVVLREEGWDDAIELRVVGLEVDTNQNQQNASREFRVQLALNAD